MQQKFPAFVLKGKPMSSKLIFCVFLTSKKRTEGVLIIQRLKLVFIIWEQMY